MTQILSFLDQILHTPIASFTILLMASLLIPPWFEKLRLPGLVGLLLAGVIFGSSGLGLLDPKSETIKLLSDIGKLYLMFVRVWKSTSNSFASRKIVL